jgi:membrane fusion protein (multidrug efflux system)
VRRPGEYARIRTIIATRKDALVVPQKAVSELQGNYQVAVVGSDNKVQIRPVKVGERIGTDWIIAQGLKPGERVVAEGVQKVHGGIAVQPKPLTSTVEAQPKPANLP